MKPPDRRAHRAHRRRGADEEAAQAGRRLPRPPLGRGRQEARGREGAGALCSSELDIVLKTARDLFTDDVDQMVIDDRGQYDRVCRFVEMFMPERLKDVLYYNDDEPIFDAYGIEDEIARALSRKVPLPSGGLSHHRRGRGAHGDRRQHRAASSARAARTWRRRSSRRTSRPSTRSPTSCASATSAASSSSTSSTWRRPRNREKVRKTLDELLQKDKAKTTLNRISELGLIEMTRKRTRESLGRLLHEPCFYCDGTGHLQSKETDRVRDPPRDPAQAAGPAGLHDPGQLPPGRGRPADGQREGRRCRTPRAATCAASRSRRAPSTTSSSSTSSGK